MHRPEVRFSQAKRKTFAHFRGIIHHPAGLERLASRRFPLCLTRCLILRTGMFASALFAFGQVTSPATPARAQSSEPQWRHGLSLFGDLKYPPEFRHFDYVNPQAPKGGRLRFVALGTFDNFNQAIAGVRGLFVAAAGTICDTLNEASFDEVSAHYGLIAEAVSHPPKVSVSPPFARAPRRATTTASRLRSRT